jgi:DNA (cytosine-5)-methyltransferase 1
MVEANDPAFRTLMHNKERGLAPFRDWPIRKIDVRAAAWSHLEAQVDVVAGGPPCQPFSIGGNHLGDKDPRDMWPEAIRAVRETLPKAFVFENVRGLLRETFSDYLMWIEHQLAAPAADAEYLVGHVPVNAADYGAAQQRHRVIVYGFRRDIADNVTPPAPTHSLDRLLWDQWVTGRYWRQHNLASPEELRVPSLFRRRVERLRTTGVRPRQLRWRTVRDALLGLGEPTGHGNHALREGARSYPGHTGSTYDFPAKALKAGAHGVPGGENMLRYPDGAVRYFTVREAARLQGFPDEMEFPGAWCENMRQLGNAVPAELAEAFAGWVKEICLQSDHTRMAA